MGINPVTAIGASQASLGETKRHEPAPARAPASRNSGNPSIPEVRTPKSDSHPPEMPQDEVQVQRDNGTNGAIVIKYLDHSGKVILQVPSEEMLGMMRAIAQDFEQREKVRSTANAGSAPAEGVKGNGH